MHSRECQYTVTSLLGVVTGTIEHTVVDFQNTETLWIKAFQSVMLQTDVWTGRFSTEYNELLSVLPQKWKKECAKSSKKQMVCRPFIGNYNWWKFWALLPLPIQTFLIRERVKIKYKTYADRWDKLGRGINWHVWHPRMYLTGLALWLK